MKLIKQEKFNREIKEDFKYNFEVERDGLYLIEIIAGAKSWWQNMKKFKSFFRDDDMAVKINGREFSKLNGKRGLFDGEAAWNGNNLKGLLKTSVFVVRLKKGECCIQFLVNQKPYLKSLAISRIESSEIAVYIPTDNNPAEDGNRRQWMFLALADLPLKSLNIKARTEKRKRDDDDLKLIINGKIQKRDKGAHKNWYWCGWNDNGSEREFSRKLSLKPGAHYIELWADRQPFLYSTKFDIIAVEKKKEEGILSKSPEQIITQINNLYHNIGHKGIAFKTIPKPLNPFTEYDNEIEKAGKEFSIDSIILKATIAQESSFGTDIEHDKRYVGESGLMGMEKNNAIAQLTKLGHSFDYTKIEDVVRASAAYYDWLKERPTVFEFKDKSNPLKLYTQYRSDLAAEKIDTPGIPQFLYYYFYYK